MTHNINKEHPMDWIVWAFIALVVLAIVVGIPALIIVLIVRANRRRRNPYGPTYGSDHS